MLDRLKTYLPTQASLHNNRWLRWIGPRLYHPHLWRMSRRGIATGLAVGVFFGFLIPVAQIPFAAASAVILRANLPVAIASTLVTNPITFAPVYYGAYHLGKFVLLEPQPSPQKLESLLEQKAQEKEKAANLTLWQRIQHGWHELSHVGKPLIVGLGIVATTAGIVVYFLAHLLWMWHVRWERRRRLAKLRHPD